MTCADLLILTAFRTFVGDKAIAAFSWSQRLESISLTSE